MRSRYRVEVFPVNCGVDDESGVGVFEWQVLKLMKLQLSRRAVWIIIHLFHPVMQSC